MKTSSTLLRTITLGTFLILTSVAAQAMDCATATRLGMAQGCSTSGGTGHEASKEVPVLTECERSRQTGMTQGCSTTGGTGTSITHTAEDGNLGTCRQSYRAGQPALEGCGSQTPVEGQVLPK